MALKKSSPAVKKPGVLLKGVFCGSPVEGLEYRTPTVSGLTDENGAFKYRAGETITFSIGGLVLGAAPGSPRVTPADLALEVGGDVTKIRNQKVTNIARLLQSLDADGDVENGITITEATRKAISKYRYRISFDQTEEDFTKDPAVNSLLAGLKKKLCSPARARNHLRRTMNGIRKMTDVRIPTRDGSYLLADVFLPIGAGKYPVVMSLGGYGKAFTFGRICNEKDLLKYEEIEDDYFHGRLPAPSTFSTGPGGHPVVAHVSENFELVNTLDWVPKGYAVVRVDERGTGKTPGLFEQFSLQEAKDYYDAIEWAGTQLWSNGRVGTWGASYYAMTQYVMAQLRPPHLKAIVPICGDIDSYRDYIYSGGGLFNPFNFVAKNSCGPWRGVDWVEIARRNPFADPAVYGTQGKICISVDTSKLDMALWSTMGIEGTIHTRGSSDAFIQSPSKHKKLTIVSEPGIHFETYARQFLEGHLAFFDYHLKGIRNGVMDEPSVRMMVRTGWSGYYWQDENEWPIARTQYAKYYLDASPSGWKGDGKRKDFFKLAESSLGKERSAAYSADVKFGAVPPWSYGVSFVTGPLAEDVLIAGYLKLVVWVASTSHDMQLHAYVRVMDENNVEVPYAVGSPARNRDYPVGQGALKVSHRKLDLKKSTVYRPYHTHLKKDYQPLQPGEIVEAQVEIWPTTALIKKGHRIRLDVQPISGAGMAHPLLDPADDTYQAGATNTVYTGPNYPSYLQLPVIPSK